MIGFLAGALGGFASGTFGAWIRAAHGAGALVCDRDGATTQDVSVKGCLLFAHQHMDHIAAVRFVSRAELAAMAK